MKILDALALAARRPEKPETSAQLRKAIEAVDIPRLDEIEAALKVERDKVLLTGTDAEVAQHDANISAARIRIERAQAAKRALEARLAEAEARERDAEAAAKRKHAEDLTAAAVAAMQSDLPAAYAAIRRVLRMIAEAEAACELVNAGAKPEHRIVSPEEWRSATLTTPEVEVRRSTANLWAAIGSPERPIAELDQRRAVDQGNGTGFLPPLGTPAPGMHALRPLELTLRRFTRIERLPRVQAEHLDPFEAALRLPAIRAGEPAGWAGPEYTSRDGYGSTLSVVETLDRIEAAAKKKPRDERKPEIVFIPVAEPAAEAA